MRLSIAAIAVLALGAGTAQAQDCRLKQYSSVTMEVSPDRLLLPVTIGTAQKQMVFRMEDSINGIAKDSAAALDLHVTSLPTNIHIQREGQELTRVAHVSQMSLGPQSLSDVEFLVLPQTHYTDAVIGDVGTRMFGTADFEIDIAHGKLNLFSPDHCPGQTVYWTKSGFAQVPLKPSEKLGDIRAEMMLDGQPVTVALSTVGRSRIGMNAMRTLFHVDETSPDLVAVNQDLLGHKLYRYPFKTLTADGLTISNPAILVYDEPPRPECKANIHFADTQDEPLRSTDQTRLVRNFGCTDAVLGLSVLSKLHLYVSGQEKMLYLTSASAN